MWWGAAVAPVAAGRGEEFSRLRGSNGRVGTCGYRADTGPKYAGSVRREGAAWGVGPRYRGASVNPFVPDFILRNDALGRTAGAFEGAVLFVEVAGLVPLTERLLPRGQPGIEMLARALRFHFDPVVAAVHEAGGFIAGFAGDGCTAVFPAAPDREVAAHALDAARRMERFVAGHPGYGTPWGEVPFSIRVGLSWGRVEWGIVRVVRGWLPGRAFHYFQGPAVAASVACQQRAGAGEVLLDAAFRRRVPDAPARPTPRLPVAWMAAPGDGASFLAPEVAEIPPHGELRDVATVSLAFAEVADVPDLIRALEELSGRHGGTFTGLGFGDGGVSSVIHFGAPVSHEDDTERALDFALALRLAATEGATAPTSGRVPRVRAGVARDVGYVGWNGGTRRRELACLGRAPTLAAGLMKAAAWGEILCDPTVHAEAAAGYAMDPRGELRLPSFPHPVPIHAVGARRATVGPPRLAAIRELVGRGPELTRLLSSIAPVFSGRFAGVIYIDGEAGLGKSFLVQTARRRLEARFAVRQEEPPGAAPYRWIEAPCDQTLQRSLHPFTVALEEYFQQSPVRHAGDREENLARFEAVLAELVARVPPGEEALRDALVGARSTYGALLGLRSPGSLHERLGPRDRFERTLAAIATWVRAESRSRPVIVHVEDAHWADGDTLRAVQAIARLGSAGETGDEASRPRLLEGLPIAVVCTARYTDDGGPFRIVLDPGVPVRNLGLVPLGADEIGRIAENVRGKPVPEALRAMLADGAGGNPFLAEEICACWSDAEPGVSAPSIASPPAARRPTDVTRLLVARLDRLPARIKRTVLAAAVLGKDFDLRVLTTMVAGDPEVAEHVRVAEVQRIFLRQGRARHAFRSSLLRNVAYEVQARARLARLHRLAAAAIEVVHEGDLERHQAALGRHYRRAGLPERARPCFLAAAREAAGRYAHSEARRHYRSYFKLVTEPGAESTLARYALARDVHEPRGDAARALDEHAAVIEEATLLRAVGLEALGYLGLGRVTLAAGQPDEAGGHLVTALERARRAGDRWTEALVLAHLALVHRATGREADAERAFLEALSLGRAAGRTEGATALGAMLAHDAAEHRPGETLALYEQAMSLATAAPPGRARSSE